jgi:hypothetical protein
METPGEPRTNDNDIVPRPPLRKLILPPKFLDFFLRPQGVLRSMKPGRKCSNSLRVKSCAVGSKSSG